MPRYITKVALAIMGDRIEPGTEVELSAEDIAHLDPADIVLLDGAVKEAPAPAPEAPVDELSHAELKEKAKALGLSASGSKADLQERITLHLADAPAPEAPVDEITSE